MHKPLETYLKQVDAQLRFLPEEQRDDEIQEIRQHLQSLVASSMENGSSEDEAVAKAIQQFGRSKQVGRELRQVWSGDFSSVSPLRRASSGAVFAIAIYGGIASLGTLLNLILGLSPDGFSQILVKGPYFELILGGAISGLIVSRFRLHWLPTPSSRQTTVSRALTAALRFSLLGLVYGAIGGAVTGVAYILAQSFDPHSTVISSTDLIGYVVACGLGYAMIGALTAGAAGALWGVVNNRSIAQSLRRKA